MGYKIGSIVGTTLGERGVALYVWTWGDFVGSTEIVGVGSEMLRIKVTEKVLIG